MTKDVSDIVISPPSGEAVELNFRVREYVGFEVHELVDRKPGRILTTEDELHEGQLLCSPFLEGFAVGSAELQDGQWYLVSGGMVAPLKRGGDDRNAWIADGWINLKAIRILEKFT